MGLVIPATAIAGFTLAEVLISLTIVGVVASLTIPNLVKNSQEKQLKVKWKKTFSTMARATMMVAADEGGSLKGICSYNGLPGARCVRDKYAKYLKMVKKCGHAEVYGNCWGDAIHFTQDGSGFILSDGTMINQGNWGSSCNNTWGTNQILRFCEVAYADVNGFKGPNEMGKDIFGFYILENRIVPFGADDDAENYAAELTCPDDGSGGLGCAAKYLME